MASEDKFIPTIQKLSRICSKARLKQYSLSDDMLEIEWDKKKMTGKEDWVVLILIGNNDLRITFASYFNALNVISLAANALQGINEHELINQCKDFMREYCSLTSGYIKGVLNMAKINVKMSLPILSRNFDEGLCLGRDLRYIYKDSWALGPSQNIFIGCSTLIQLSDIASLKEFNNLDIFAIHDQQKDFLEFL